MIRNRPFKLSRWLFVLALAVLGSSAALAQEATEAPAPPDVTLVPLADEVFMVEGLVPAGWPEVSPGLYTRSSGVGDETWIVIQSTLAQVEPVLQALAQQLRLDGALESSGEYAGQTLAWTLYSPDTATPAVDRVVQVAVANQAGRTFFVMLQSTAAEVDALRETVLLPVLDALAPLVEATAEPGSLPYSEQNVTFENGDVTLAGTLTLPAGDGPHPAVVLVTGSGPQDRDESLAPVSTLKPFRLIADALARAGIAVLRYDDRGVGQSSGIFEEATLDDFTADANAAIDYLLSRDEIDPQQIGLIGHSEGGMVASKLGAQDAGLAYIVTLAGPGVNGRDVLFLQNVKLMQVAGATQEQIDSQLVFLDESIALMDAEDWDGLETLIRDTVRLQYDQLSEAQQASIGDIDSQVDQVTAAQMQSFRAGWFASFINYDPAPDWAQVDVPVLAFYGGLDVQVDAEQNAPPLQAALEDAGNADVTVIVYPEANHLFQAARTGALQEYGALEPAFVPDLLPDLTAWLLAHVTLPE